MRKHLATILFSVALLACNSDSRSPVGPLSLEPDAAIGEAVRGGRGGFYFLHPFVTKPGVVGPFDATLAPGAGLCAVNPRRTVFSHVIAATPLTGSGLT